MRINISLTISTILFHTIYANRKITCKGVKHFSILNYPLVQRAKMSLPVRIFYLHTVVHDDESIYYHAFVACVSSS